MEDKTSPEHPVDHFYEQVHGSDDLHREHITALTTEPNLSQNGDSGAPIVRNINESHDQRSTIFIKRGERKSNGAAD